MVELRHYLVLEEREGAFLVPVEGGTGPSDDPLPLEDVLNIIEPREQHRPRLKRAS